MLLFETASPSATVKVTVGFALTMRKRPLGLLPEFACLQWSDEGIVIGLRHHGETGVIVELLTRERGRHGGFVHGGRSRRLRAVLQPGNAVRATWQARAEEQLGSMTLEPINQRAARIMASALALQGANLVCALARLLPEREPQADIYTAIETILDRIDDDTWTPGAVVALEVLLLRELGFGLALDRCAVTGTADDLAYVSPRTGRVVSRIAGEPYRDRIFALPSFLIVDVATPAPSFEDISAGFALTEHFLNRDVFMPRGLPIPDCRRAYIRAIATART